MNHFYTSTFQNHAFSWWLYIQRNWFKGLLIFIFLYLYFTKDISISFGMVDRDYPQMQQPLPHNQKRERRHKLGDKTDHHQQQTNDYGQPFNQRHFVKHSPCLPV